MPTGWRPDGTSARWCSRGPAHMAANGTHRGSAPDSHIGSNCARRGGQSWSRPGTRPGTQEGTYQHEAQSEREEEVHLVLEQQCDCHPGGVHKYNAVANYASKVNRKKQRTQKTSKNENIFKNTQSNKKRNQKAQITKNKQN